MVRTNARSAALRLHHILLGASLILASAFSALPYLVLLLPAPLTLGLGGSTLCGMIALARYRDFRRVPYTLWLTYGLAVLFTSLILASVLANGDLYKLYFGLVALLLIAGLMCLIWHMNRFLWLHFLALSSALIFVPTAIVIRIDSALINTVEKGNIDHSRILLALGSNPNAATNATTALKSTVTTYDYHPGNIELMRLLLDYGADPNATSPDYNTLTALSDAAFVHRLDMMALLLERGANPNYLEIAAQLGDTAMMDLLLQYGADPNISTHAILVRPPLFYAEQPEIAQYLLDHGAQLTLRDEFGRTALFSAVDNGNTAMINFYLTRDFDINARDIEGKTPLFAARDTEVAAYLLQHGAQPAIRDTRGRTALFDAAANANMQLAAFFIAQGLDVNARDPIGRTALFAAVEPSPYRYPLPEIVETLIAHGADVNVTDVYGQSILAEARANKYDRIVALLIAAGAK